MPISLILLTFTLCRTSPKPAHSRPAVSPNHYPNHYLERTALNHLRPFFPVLALKIIPHFFTKFRAIALDSFPTSSYTSNRSERPRKEKAPRGELKMAVTKLERIQSTFFDLEKFEDVTVAKDVNFTSVESVDEAVA